MKVFTRTAAGIANYPNFHGAEIVVYIEGRKNEVEEKGGLGEPTGLAVPADEIFFGAVLSAATKGKKLKIKCVGSKSAALAYALKIERGEIKNSIVLVDKDLDGIASSPINETCVIRTFGYSWENELWSEYTLQTLLGQLTNENALAAQQLDASLNVMARRLGYLSALDASAQTADASVLTKRNSLCGVGFDFSRACAVSAVEIKRISSKYRATGASSCPVAAYVLKKATSLPTCQIIQGHFWESATIKLLAHIYRKRMKDSMPSNKILLNLALAIVRREPEKSLGEAVFSRYRNELARTLT